MKKYRVITDNLDWVGIVNGTVMEIGDVSYSVTCKTNNGNFVSITTPREFDDKGYLKAFESHPEWFEEIKEKEHIRRFSLKDMIEFGRFVYDKVKPRTVPIDMILLDQWLQKAYPEDCVTKK